MLNHIDFILLKPGMLMLAAPAEHCMIVCLERVNSAKTSSFVFLTLVSLRHAVRATMQSRGGFYGRRMRTKSEENTSRRHTGRKKISRNKRKKWAQECIQKYGLLVITARKNKPLPCHKLRNSRIVLLSTIIVQRISELAVWGIPGCLRWQKMTWTDVMRGLGVGWDDVFQVPTRRA